MKTFREKLFAGEPLIGMEIGLCDPCISELVGQNGYDFLWIDTEHSAMDYHTLLMHIIAAKAGGAASIVRVPFNEVFLAKRALEMGPDGIIFPQVTSAAEVRKAINACIYPPDGERGFGPRRACQYGMQSLETYIAGAKERTTRIIQIEHVGLVNELDEALTIEGVDAFMIGPCDLAGSIGRVNDIYCPEILGMIDTVVEKCRAAGKPVGIAIGSSAKKDLEFWRDRGFNFISASGDLTNLFLAAQAQYKTMREVLGGERD